MPLNHTLKMVKMANFITYINICIYHNKKETNTNVIVPIYHNKNIISFLKEYLKCVWHNIYQNIDRTVK